MPEPAPQGTNICNQCNYYDKNGGGSAPPSTCRWWPPYMNAGWPVVKASDWCGQWAAIVVAKTEDK